VASIVIGILTLVLGLALFYVLFLIWPAVEAVSGATELAEPQKVTFFGTWTVTVSPQTIYLVMVVVVATIGSIVHVATSFGSYVGNRTFKAQWTWWYVLRPLVGASIAILLYFAVVGGILSVTSEPSDVSPFGLAAIAGLAGLFSKQATDKLEEVFNTAFRVGKEAGDAQRADKLDPNPPTIDSLNPPEVPEGADATITILGANLPTGATIRVNDATLAPELVSTTSSSEVTIDVPADLLQAPQVHVTVTDPVSGLQSEPAKLRIAAKPETS
jgi:hypothetical protein